jgi:hypothetical protein
MRIGILGPGLTGGKLGTIFARAGTPAGLAGKLILTCSLPRNEANTTLVAAHTSSGASTFPATPNPSRCSCAATITANY